MSRERWEGAILLLCAAAVVWRLLGVDVFPVAPNDTVAYLLHAGDLAAGGLIEHGYRLVGYPAWLAASDALAARLPVDALFLAAALQRLLLAATCLTALALLRAAGLPLALALSSTALLTLANVLIPEGLLVSLGALFGVLLARLSLGTRRGGAALAVGTFALACGLFAVLFAIKPPFALFGLPLAAAAWGLAARVRRARAPVAALLLATVAASLAFTVALSLENRRERGELRPVSEGARLAWFGAHLAVFGVEPANRGRPELAPWWDDGSPYGFLHALERRESDYERRAPALRRRTSELFAAAGTSAWRERLRAFAGYWIGGRSDDIGRRLAQVANARGLDIGRVARDNHYARRHGVEAFHREFAGGRVPLYAELRARPARWSLGYRRLQAGLGLATVAVLAVALRRRHTRGLAAATLTSLTLTGVALAWHFADVWRYVLPGFAIAGGVASGVLHLWLGERRPADAPARGPASAAAPGRAP